MKHKELTGSALKKIRESKGIKGTFVAASLHISPPYLSMLEADKRRWPPGLIPRYMEAIGE